MVKIRLRRIGTKGRPFYRIVIAPDRAGRNGRFVEVIGTYDPVAKPKVIQINEERAMHWLREGAQPSETTAYLLNKMGILEKFLAERPTKRKDFKFLDKTTAATSIASVMDTSAPEAAAEPEPVKEEAPVAEPTVEEAAPAAEEAPSEQPAEEAAAEKAE